MLLNHSFESPEQNKTITIEEYNKEIEDSEAEIERGVSYTHDQVIKICKKLDEWQIRLLPGPKLR